MSDVVLRALERVALSSGDTAAWRRYYDERRRLGLGLPSGEARWEADLPGPVMNLVASLGSGAGPGSGVVEAVEDEWARCGTWIAVCLRDSDGCVQFSCGGVEWEAIGRAGCDLRVPGRASCATCSGRGSFPGLYLPGPPDGGQCLACDGTGVVHPRVPLDLGPRAEVRGPEFLGEGLFLATWEPAIPSQSSLAESLGVGWVKTRRVS